MNDGTVGTSDPRSARRRLLRGAFATPAVLALHSGSALAAASSLRCVKAQTPVYPSYADAPDVYLRVQLHALWESVPGASNVLGWYLSGSLVEAARFGYKKVLNSFLPSGQWMPVELLLNGQARLGLASSVAPSPAERFTLGPKWVALRVLPTKTGGSVEIIGVVDGTTLGSAVTGSCWSSFAVVGAGL